jgi:hypothetical protein
MSSYVIAALAAATLNISPHEAKTAPLTTGKGMRILGS